MGTQRVLATDMCRDECLSRLVSLLERRPVFPGLSIARSADRMLLAGVVRTDGIDAVVIDPLPAAMRQAAEKVPALASQVGTVGVHIRVSHASVGSTIRLGFYQPLGDLLLWSAILAITLSVVEWNILDLALVAPAFGLFFALGPIIRRESIRRAEAAVVVRVAASLEARSSGS